MRHSNTAEPRIISRSPFVAMLTAPNPGPKTLTGTHTFVVGKSPGYVIDPGPTIPAHQEVLARWLHDEGNHVEAILLSHGHPDHAPGAATLQRFLGTPVWAPAPTEGAGTTIDRRYSPQQTFHVEGDTLAILPSPGHTPDHVAFWLERSRILFAGDTILGQGTTLIAPPEGDMIEYMRTLDRFRELDPKLILPGHGPIVTEPQAKIAEYIEHRKQREHQVLDALKDGPAMVGDLVRRIYAEVSPELQRLAVGSVEGQLAKLEVEGKVTRQGDEVSLARR